MKLDDRLQALADFVPEGARAADIGTDHGYLAVALVESGKAVHVMASDLNRGPCEAAKRTVAEAGLGKSIDVRQGDGLAPLAPGEADTICIAGMGGVLMTQILEAGADVLAKTRRLVLQPMNGAGKLRRWLYQKDWHIDGEKLAVADGRLYEILTAVPGKAPMPEPILLEIGPVLWHEKPALLQQHIEALLFSARREAAGMEKSEQAVKSEKYRLVKAYIEALEAHLKG